MTTPQVLATRMLIPGEDRDEGAVAFRAVGKAHLATNLPLFTHTNMGRGGLEQLDVLESVGVDPKRVTIGYLGGLAGPKAEVQRAICKRGAFVGFDRQGGPGDKDQMPAPISGVRPEDAPGRLMAPRCHHSTQPPVKRK